MKMKNYILFLGVVLLGLFSCDDFLEVNSDSKYDKEFVYSSKIEMNKALTAVYAALMDGNTYGNSYMSSFALNSDVEFSAFSGSIRSVNGEDFKCFDGTRHGSSIANTWTSVYLGVERANLFIEGAETSKIYSEQDADIMRMIGEAKVLRAMFYHDLVVLCGDIPFTLKPTADSTSFHVPIADRNEILTKLINDLRSVAKYLPYASTNTEGVERVSKEFCYSMIARMALTRGGYSLYPDINNPAAVGTMKRPADYIDYYEIAKNYADSVISSNTHSLTKEFRNVFIDECNYIVSNNDDPIFEIPFARNSSGNVGYVHGPSGSTVNGETSGSNIWGASNGGVRLNAFYRFTFDPKDLRLDYTVGMWYYEANGTPTIRNDYSTHCNKWSKFWTNTNLALGKTSSDKTGINYPYMRYADVLLMYAEAVNELENGVAGTNGAKAINALRQVRNRAFLPADRTDLVENYLSLVSASKSTFFDAIIDERAWEFGGENMRWKDLVRWNKYSEAVYSSFTMYYNMGLYVKGAYFGSEFDDMPVNLYYKVVDNPKNTAIYPNVTLPILEIYNPYSNVLNPGIAYTAASFYAWAGSDASELPVAQCLYSFRGYVRMGEEANYETMDITNLPPVRYILPIPNKVLQLANGKYKNYYGYN